MNFREPGRSLAVLALATLVVGCEAKSNNVKVRGSVSLDGKPLSSGVVQFHPQVGQVATGEIGDGGEFVLSTRAPGDGVPAGTYRVTVAAYDPTASVQAPEHLIVPLRYTRSGASGLQVTIFPDTKAPVKIELVSGDPESDRASAGSRSAARAETADTSAEAQPAQSTVEGDAEGGSSGSPSTRD